MLFQVSQEGSLGLPNRIVYVFFIVPHVNRFSTSIWSLQ
jgi:hypothetical protein